MRPLSTPPPIPSERGPVRTGPPAPPSGLDESTKRAWKRRFAVAFSVVLPGVGHLMHRRWISGGVFMVVFGACFLTAVVLFLIGAANYFSMASDGNILEGDKLERLPEVFRPKWLIGLAITGGVTWLAALLDLGRISRGAAPSLSEPRRTGSETDGER